MSNAPKAETTSLFELGATLVGTAARVSLSVASLPLILLPSNTRVRMRHAMAEVARGLIVLPKEITAASERVVDDIFSGEPVNLNLNLPSVDKVGEQARAFTERLSKAAEEFGASMGRVTSQAADSVEKAAAKVDEWVEKPPTTPSA